MESSSDVLGVALAGGASRRMGRDKTRLRLAGQTLLESTVERLRSVCREVVVADRGRGRTAGAAAVADGPGAGPAAGILGAAAARPGRPLLVLACDLPRVPAALLASLAADTGADWVVPVWGDGRYEPLCARYGERALAALAAQVRCGAYAVHRLAGAPGLEVRCLDDTALAAFGRPAEIFFNVNTPDDVAALALRREASDG